MHGTLSRWTAAVLLSIGVQAASAADTGQLVYSTEGNRLRRYDLDTIGSGALAEDILVERASGSEQGGGEGVAGVKRDVNGQIGGIFLLENSALSFARSNSGPAGCATIYLSDPIELDLENRGNPLVVRLGQWIRGVMGQRQRMVAFIGKTAESVKRRLKAF